MKLTEEINSARKGEALNFTLAETAELANVSRGVLRREAKLGRLRTVKIGSRYLVPRREVARLLGIEAD